MVAERPQGLKAVAAVAALAALSLAIYWQCRDFSLIALDDYDYITNNPLVTGGLTATGVWGAFTTAWEGYWTPLLWLSYMADFSLWGGTPGAIHLVNLALFSLGAALLFLFLRSATGDAAKSFFAAALWAVHPMRVESVAWAAERKDLLAGIFFILALWSHVEWARSGKGHFRAALFFFALLGLMAKPVLVVLPIALLLLDFWPLGRFKGADGLKPLVLEKAPVIALSALFTAITLYTQIAQNPWAPGNTPKGALAGVGGYLTHLQRTVWPSPDVLIEAAAEPTGAGVATGIAALLFMAALFAAAWRVREMHPALLFGWGWFVLILLPNSGIVAAGLQRYSDRFSHLPHIGLFVALVWLSHDLSGEGKRKILAALAVALIAVLAVRSHATASHWRNSLTLFSRADEVRGGANALAKNSLAIEYAIRQNPAKALEYFREVERLQPCYPLLKYNTALLFHSYGRDAEALEELSGGDCPDKGAYENETTLELKINIEETMKGRR